LADADTLVFAGSEVVVSAASDAEVVA